MLNAATGSYDLVLVGTGFGAAFFLHGALPRLSPAARVLVLERGGHFSHARQIAEQRNSEIESASTIRVPAGHKSWQFTLGFGGGSNCWWGVTPRLHPTDFELRSRYGVGRDWPIGYDDIEPYYAQAETIMGIAGPPEIATLFPRSAPFPQPPHRLSAPDLRMRRGDPAHHFALPTARSRVATATRGVCCANATCSLCPNDAKFTVLNGLAADFADPRVTLMTGAEVLRFETRAGMISGAVFRHDGRETVAAGDLFVLGANAIFSPALLQRSGIAGAPTGNGLHEQLGAEVEVQLDGLDAFDGSTATTGINYALFDGPHRRSASGVAVLFRNHWWHGLRTEAGRWRQTLPLLLIAEDLPSDDNQVVAAGSDGPPLVAHAARSTYAHKGIERALEHLPRLLAPLPVERIVLHGLRDNEAHMQGTLRMGRSPHDSVIDVGQVHHRARNLVVVGTAVFPTCGCANPSLTAAALSLRAADRLL